MRQHEETRIPINAFFVAVFHSGLYTKMPLIIFKADTQMVP